MCQNDIEKNMEKIKILREKTGAGMVDCKKALDEAGDDIEKAVEILRKKGITKAAKREDRKTSEGIIKVAVNDEGTEGYIVEVNSETDFVARNEQFQNYVNNVMELIIAKTPNNLEELLNSPMESETVKEVLDHLSGVIGEKLKLKRFDVLKGSTVSAYSHLGGKIGVLVSLDKIAQDDLAYEMAMQIAASNPKYIKPEDVDPAELAKEKEIYKEQLSKEGKPEVIIEKIMAGKVNKYYEDVCLNKQEYIKDDKQKVEQILGGINIEKFIRYSLG
jgi:elongation factor Ts